MCRIQVHARLIDGPLVGLRAQASACDRADDPLGSVERATHGWPDARSLRALCCGEESLIPGEESHHPACPRAVQGDVLVDARVQHRGCRHSPKTIRSAALGSLGKIPRHRQRRANRRSDRAVVVFAGVGLRPADLVHLRFSPESRAAPVSVRRRRLDRVPPQSDRAAMGRRSGFAMLPLLPPW
jgi:hypothetical protein